MIKNSFLLACSLLLSICSFSQQISQAIIASAGDVNTAGRTVLEWTLGEPVIETFSFGNLLLTQGFHQPMLRSKISPVSIGLQKEVIVVTISPNPVQNVCTAVIKRDTDTNLYLMLTDSRGRLLSNRVSSSKVDAIDFNLASYASGVYMLTLVTANGSIYKSYKIIKAN
jgi:hypothetical protein